MSGTGKTSSGEAKKRIRQEKKDANEELLKTIPKRSSFGFRSNVLVQDTEANQSEEKDAVTAEQVKATKATVNLDTTDKTMESDNITVETTIETDSHINSP